MKHRLLIDIPVEIVEKLDELAKLTMRSRKALIQHLLIKSLNSLNFKEQNDLFR